MVLSYINFKTHSYKKIDVISLIIIVLIVYFVTPIEYDLIRTVAFVNCNLFIIVFCLLLTCGHKINDDSDVESIGSTVGAPLLGILLGSLVPITIYQVNITRWYIIVALVMYYILMFISIRKCMIKYILND